MRRSFRWQPLTVTEKLLLGFFALLIIGSSATLIVKFYYAHTVIAPAQGGIHIEGALGIPRFINPALAQVSDVDRDITRLVYSGLMKYTKEGKLVGNLAENFSIQDEKIYTFKLHDTIFWHDGEPFTADDVVFTIKLIQDPKYASPIRLNWQGVEVEKVDDRTVRFTLLNTYSPFLENTTVGILPKHIWENVSPKSFPLAEANLRPIGTGPYKFEKFQKDASGDIKSYSLKANTQYYEKVPNLERIVFKFFESEDEAIVALKNGEISAMSFLSGSNSSQVEFLRDETIHTFSLPRYFAVFFNQSKSKVLKEKEVRQALAVATDREEIIRVSAAGKGQPAFGPIIRELLGYNPQIEGKYQFSLEQAKKILDDAKWLDTNGDGVREKILPGVQTNDTATTTVKTKGAKGTVKPTPPPAIEPTPLEINLITVQWPELEKTVRVLKEQWEKIGVKVDIHSYTLGEIQQNFIRPREYETIVFGEVLGIDPDPFSFWHSSQKKDPGLNLALYENKTADKLLEEARQTLNSETRAEKYILFQNAVSDDIPAIFLYSPSYLYPVSKNVKGMKEGKIGDPSWRFSDVADWYIKTKRVWK